MLTMVTFIKPKKKKNSIRKFKSQHLTKNETKNKKRGHGPSLPLSSQSILNGY